MQIVSKIDHLISKLTSLKPELSNDSSQDEKKFNEIIKSSLDVNYRDPSRVTEAKLNPISKVGYEVPGWVDPDYGYNPLEPRKPNMRELMQVISGKDVEDLYNEPDESWIEISNQAAEILYGVVGSNTDTRDWQFIMASENILKTAQEQTGSMYGTKVEVESSFDNSGKLTEQIAYIKDRNGVRLRSLSTNISSTAQALYNFGATAESIPSNLEETVDPNFFDKNLLTFLKNFNSNPLSIDKEIIQTASEVIATKLSHEIPLDQLSKL